MITVARGNRRECPGSFSHVYNRGNNKAQIYFDREDYEKFLDCVLKSQELFPFELISYCIMPNHFHLQIKIIEHSLGEIMHRICMNYARYFNKKYELVGHVFQGRYKSVIIENDAQLIRTSRYIHLNPVEANLVKNPVEYKWSSYGVYMGKRTSKIVSPAKMIETFFGKDIKRYRDYVEWDFDRSDDSKMPNVIRKFEEDTHS